MEGLPGRVKRCRLAKGWSQRDLGAHAGISFAFVNRIEVGTRNPGLKTLRSLADALDVSPYWLETGDERGTMMYLTYDEIALAAQALERVEVASSVSGYSYNTLHDRLKTVLVMAP